MRHVSSTRPCLFALLVASLSPSLLLDAQNPPVRNSDAAQRAMAAHRIAKTGVYAEGDIAILVSCLGDFTRLVPADINMPIPPGPYTRDRRETSPSKEAEAALLRIGKPAVPRLLAALKAGSYGKAGSHNTFSAARVLGMMRERSALPRLRELASGGEFGHQNERGADDEFPVAIARIGKKAEYEFLRSLLERAERENRVNSGLLEAIGYSEDERGVPILKEYFEKGDRYRRLEVIPALGHTRSPKAVAVLLPYVQSEDWHFRTYSQDALRELGRSDLIPKAKAD